MFNEIGLEMDGVGKCDYEMSLQLVQIAYAVVIRKTNKETTTTEIKLERRKAYRWHKTLVRVNL